MKGLSFAILIGALSLGVTARACPERLRNLKTEHLPGSSLCEVFDRYQSVKTSLEAKGFTPAVRVGNLMAPRFVNLPYWQKKRDRTGDSAWAAYQPVPNTWLSWASAAAVIDAQAQANFESHHLARIDLQWLVALQASSVSSVRGELTQFRNNQEIGMVLKRAKALRADQILAIDQISYPRWADASVGLTHFVPTACLEDQPAAFQDAFANSNRPTLNLADWIPRGGAKPFVDANGVAKQCGLIMYAPASETQPQLFAWIDFVNSTLAKLNDPILTDVDLVAFAARAQRWLIAIHPFPGGNGRTSRLVMDYIFESLGLPPPILADMDDDLYTSEKNWADQVGRGLRRAITLAQTCVNRPDARGCATVKPSIEQKSVTRMSEKQ